MILPYWFKYLFNLSPWDRGRERGFRSLPPLETSIEYLECYKIGSAELVRESCQND